MKIDRVTELESALAAIANHRQECWEYDEDMGREPREFLDTEEWERIEQTARAALGEEQDGTG